MHEAQKLGIINDHLTKCEKSHLKNITAPKQQHQTKVNGSKTTIKLLQCEIRSVESDMGCLKEHLKKTNKELHSKAQATNVIDIQTKNGTTYGDAGQLTSYHTFVISCLSYLSSKSSKLWAIFGCCDFKPLPYASAVENMVSKTSPLKKAVEGMRNSE